MQDSDVRKGMWVKSKVTIKSQGSPYLLKGTLVRVTSDLIEGRNGNHFTAKTDGGKTFRLFPGQVDKA